MAITEILSHALARGMRLLRARVVAVEVDGVRVRVESAPGEEILCDVLHVSGDAAIPLRSHEKVLIACHVDPGHRGVLIGTIGPAPASEGAQVGSTAGMPETVGRSQPAEAPPFRGRQIVIEAGEELTLRCGEASIRISRDGKIVIRGEHVLSRAKGTNRIKGGSVAIN